MKKLLVVDGNSLVNRAFYALPLLTNKRGEYSNAVYGFVNILVKFITEHNPTHIAVAFDHARKTFRNDLYEQYKGTRKGMPDELRSQMPILKQVLGAMNIKMFEKDGFEADDLIGTIAKSANCETIVLSGDRDVLQLVDDKISVWLTKKGITDVLAITTENIEEEYGCSPSQVVELKAIMGDTADNIPGVAGIGKVGALNLVKTYGTLDNVYENIENIKGALKQKLIDGKDNAYLSKTLATIKTDCDIDFCLDDCTYDFPFGDEVLSLFDLYEFKSILKRKELFKTTNKLEQYLEENKEELQDNLNKKNIIKINDIKQIEKLLKTEKMDFFAFDFNNKIEFCFDEKNLYEYSPEITLFNLQDGQISFNEIVEILNPIFQNEKILKITQELKQQMHLYPSLSQIKGEVFDIGIAKYLLYTGEKYTKETEVFDYYFLMKKYQKNMQVLGLENIYKNIEMPLVKVLYEMENQGFKINTQMLDELSEEYMAELEFLTKQIHEYAGEEFNINSPKVLATILFEKLELSDKGNKKHSTNIDVLNDISSQHPIVPLIIRYRKIQKLSNTYIQVYKNLVEKQGDIIYTIFNQTLTATGRLSSSEPNLQNIPVRDEEGKKLRKLFISRFKDGQVVSADYNQIELRLLANFSGDKNMIDGYKNNADIHRATASKIFGKPLEMVDGFERSAAKSVNFGIVYGISAYGLANQLGITNGQAKDFMERYLSTYPCVMDYMNKNIEFAKQNGYSKTYYGRIRRINEISSLNKNMAMFGERVAMNAPLQGTASDVIKLAMIDVYNKLEQKQLKSKLILQIHDELIIDCPKQEVEEVKELVKQCMENVAHFEVPLVVSVNSGNTWFDSH